MSETLRNTYNNELPSSSDSRRKFIRNSSFLIGGLLLGISFKGISNSSSINNKITNKALNPRFKTKKQITKVTNCRAVELKALDLIKQNRLEEASEMIYSELNKKKNSSYLNGYVRLFDLLVLICYKDCSIYKSKYENINNIAKNSNVKVLIDRTSKWNSIALEDFDNLSKRKYWDKNILG